VYLIFGDKLDSHAPTSGYFRAYLKMRRWNAFFLVLDKSIIAFPGDLHLIETCDVTFFAFHTSRQL